MVEPFNEATLFEVINEIMNTETIDHLAVEDQLLVMDLVADSIRRYKALELNELLQELDEHYKKELLDK